MSRPSQQAESRAKIREAAARAIVSGRGQPPLRLVDVAAEASMSPGAILYYYDNIDDLLRECQRHAMVRFVDQRRRHLETDASPDRQLAAVLAESLPVSADDPDYVLFYGDAASRRDPARAVLSCAIFDASVELYRQILQRGAQVGVFQLSDSPLQVAQTLGSMEDGLGIYLVNGHPFIDRAEATRLLMRYIELATGVDLSQIQATEGS